MSVALVQSIKAQLVAQGVSLSGPCGAFEIVKRVAWALREQGYGLLGGKSPAQNGCAVGTEKYAVDWILKASGAGVDILADAGGLNTPVWIEEHADPAFYRPAIDPGGTAPAPPTPAPPPVSGCPHVTYDQLIHGQAQAYANQIAAALDKYRGGWAPTDFANFFWKLVVEGVSMEDVLKEIRG